MTYSNDNEREKYIKFHHLQDSYIDKKIIYQYRNVIPQQKIVGKTVNNERIFFEETRGSLVKRNYGKSKEVTSWNLLISDGIKSEILTQEKFDEIVDIITFFGDYTCEYIENFIANNTKRTNVLKVNKKFRKRYTIWADAEEFEIIQEFIKKLRERRK